MSTTPNESTLVLYSIGHSNLSFEEFVTHLKQNGITVLVDVRSQPVSKYVPHFNHAALKTALPENQIEYRYAGDYLGGQPKEEEVYKGNQRPEKDHLKPEDFRRQIRYAAVMHLPNYQTGLQHLVRIVREAAEQGGKVAMMCSEGNPRDCHRHHLIARSLLDPTVRVLDVTVQVRHILRDGELEAPLDPAEFQPEPPEQLSLF